MNLTENQLIIPQADSGGQLVDLVLSPAGDEVLGFNANGVLQVLPFADAFKIHTLPAYSAPLQNPDEFALYDDSAGGTRKITWQDLLVEFQAAVSTTAPSFRAFKTGQQAGIVTDTDTKITFTDEQLDTDTAYDTGQSRFTAPADGQYAIHAQVVFVDLFVPNLVQLVLVKNGTDDVAVNLGGRLNSSGADTIIDVQGLLSLSQGDYVEVFARHLAPSNQTAGDVANGATCVFEGFMIAAYIPPSQPSGYDTIINQNVTTLTQRTKLNFQAPFIASDDAGNSRTNVTMLAQVAPGGAVLPGDEFTFDSWGKITGVTPITNGTSKVAIVRDGVVPSQLVNFETARFRDFVVDVNTNIPTGVYFNDVNGAYMKAPVDGFYIVQAVITPTTNIPSFRARFTTSGIAYPTTLNGHVASGGAGGTVIYCGKLMANTQIYVSALVFGAGFNQNLLVCTHFSTSLITRL